jgi:hypothetical protein
LDLITAGGAEAKVTPQCRDHRGNTARGTGMRALIDDEPAYRLGLDRGEINAAVAELLQEEITDNAPP